MPVMDPVDNFIVERAVRLYTECTDCSATVGKSCVTSGGLTRNAHPARIQRYREVAKYLPPQKVTQPTHIVSVAASTGSATIRFEGDERNLRTVEQWRRALYENSRQWYRTINHELPDDPAGEWTLTIAIDLERGMKPKPPSIQPALQ